MSHSIDTMTQIPTVSGLPTKAAVSLRDWRKLERHIKQAKQSLANMDKGNTDRIERTMRSIAKIQAMRPEALDGGAGLKAYVLAGLWDVYARLELEGLDDSHYMLTDRPQTKEVKIVSEADRVRGWVFYKPGRKVERIFRDSAYSAEDQYLILSAYEKFK